MSRNKICRNFRNVKIKKFWYLTKKKPKEPQGSTDLKKKKNYIVSVILFPAGDIFTISGIIFYYHNYGLSHGSC